MPMHDDDTARLLAAAKARSGQLRRRRNALAGGGLAAVLAVAITVPAFAFGGSTAGQSVHVTGDDGHHHVVAPPTTPAPTTVPTTTRPAPTTEIAPPTTPAVTAPSTVPATTAPPPGPGPGEPPPTTPLPTSTVPATTSTTDTSGITYLTPSPQLLSQLAAMWADLQHVPVADVATPTGAEEASDGATSTYYAYLRFEPVPTAPRAVTVAFQDTANLVTFATSSPGVWTIARDGGVFGDCSRSPLPLPLRHAWVYGC